MDAIESISKSIVETEYDDIPKELVKIAKRGVTDTVGTLIAGSNAPGCHVLIGQIKEWGGKEESTIFVHGGKVPSYNAGLVNAAMARALDYDDVVDGRGLHVDASLVPTAFAVAEQCGEITGKEFLVALVTGMDVLLRITCSARLRGWDPSEVCGVFATTAVAGKLHGLNEKQLVNAFGIALNQAAGTMQSNIDGALTVRLNQGLASRNGIFSAILAKRGFTGVSNVLQGLFGYYSLFSHDKCDVEVLTEHLGEKFRGTEIVIKPYPSCRATHSVTDAALSIVQKHDFRPGDVEEITASVPEGVGILVGRKFEARDTPQVDAQFSAQYTIANALVRKKVLLDHFTEKFIRDPEVLGIAKKVKLIVKREFTGEYVEVTLKLKDGSKHTESVEFPKGSIQNPMTGEEQMQKFWDCVRYGRTSLPGSDIKNFVDIVDRLEKIDDVSVMSKLLRRA